MHSAFKDPATAISNSKASKGSNYRSHAVAEVGFHSRSKVALLPALKAMLSSKIGLLPVFVAIFP